MSHRLLVRRPAALSGRVDVPGDKSLTHRALMLGAIASGPCTVRHPLMGEDCRATLRALESMGLAADWVSGHEVVLRPAQAWHAPAGPIDCGNSGTTVRLLSGLIASRPIEATLIGDDSLSRRPMRRIAEPLRLMGAEFKGDTPPITIRGRERLTAIRYATPIASAQVKSCVLLAGLRAEGVTTVIEPFQSRDHTERMLRAAGVPVEVQGLEVSVVGGSTVQPFEFEVPGDISSAAFFLVAGAIVPEANLELRGVGMNPSRTGILEVFAQCGLTVREDHHRDTLGEPIADLYIQEQGPGMPFEIGGAVIPRLIDEIPILSVLATQLDGTSRIRDASELRAKETDRIETVAAGLRAMGADVRTRPDGLEIDGPVRLKGALVEAQGDHRVAMAFAIAGLIAEGETILDGAESIQTSYPNFESDLWRLCTF